MLVIRRKISRNQSYTVFMMADYYREWPTSDYEHQEILRIFKQDGPYQDVINDFSEYKLSDGSGPSNQD